MFGDGLRAEHDLKTCPEELTHLIMGTSWDQRESVLIEAHETEQMAFKRPGPLPPRARIDLFGSRLNFVRALFQPKLP